MLAAGVAFGQAEPRTFGTQDQVVSRVGFTDFVSCCANVGADYTGTPVSAFGLYSSTASGVFYAVGHVPTGALLTRFELEYCDFSLSGKHVNLRLLDCDAVGVDCATDALAELNSSGGTPGCGAISKDLTNLNYTMRNGDRQLVLVGSTTATDKTNTLNGALIAYRLQINPAPASATFADVPTSHLYFRAIEALAASGITSGCGGGNFCPSQAVTRGELAKFLAVALGLHWTD